MALARRISCNRRSFACAQDDALLQRGISPTRHCETRSVEAIHKSSLKRVQTDTSKRKGNGIPWIASLPLAMTPFGAFRDDNVLKKKAAFTLAEVLITLGIIGIIAAMTLPTLIANYQKKVVETRVKAFYSKMNQIYLRSYVDNGDTADWLVSKRYTYDETVDWLKKYFLPYTKNFDLQSATTTNETESGPWTQNVVIVRIPDGTAYAFSVDENGMDIGFFVNGNINDLGPRNKFTFQFSKRKNYLTDEGSMEKQSLNFIDPYILNWDGRRETLFTHGTWGCRKGCTNCAYCTKLLQLNGWEIPDDYPW